MNAETQKRALLLSLCAFLSLPGVAFAVLEAPTLKIPTGLESAEPWRKDIVLEARSSQARIRLTRLDTLKSKVDIFNSIDRDADRLKALGAKVENRLRALLTAKGHRLLAIESMHRKKRLFTGYVSGPKNTYAFLASGLPLSEVVTAVKSLTFPGEENQASPTVEKPLAMPEKLRDSPADVIPQTPVSMVEKKMVSPSPWPGRITTLMGVMMVILGLGFMWRLLSWAYTRRGTTAGAPPGSAAALTPLPPFKHRTTALTPLPLPKRVKQRV
ncbi:MAG: hypothetical protein COB53_05165 [Elusimicrobia bacterium]|nr:MAG: hypothetical protein COB53_05165 [Elusimicrobiota bacterium]